MKLEKLTLFTGIFLFALSWIMEINFHYFQGFSSATIPDDIFWKAEMAIAPISTILMLYGIFLVVIYFKARKEKRDN